MIKFRPMTLREFVVLIIFCVLMAYMATAKADPPNKGDDWRPPKYVPADIVVNKNTIDRSTNIEQVQANTQTTDLSVDTAMTFNAGDTNIPDDITVRNTAAGRAPSVYPSGNCYMGWSAGLGLPGFNVGGGKATLDENCDARETARMFYQFGEREKAIRILCAQPAAAALDVCEPAQDYHREIADLKAQNQLLLEDNGKLSDQVRDYCRESADRSLKACAK